MHLTVQAGTEIPIYRQIMRQVMDAIADGRLKPGDQVPSQRDVGERLGIAWITVKKAYEELEGLGYLETQRGRGTFVSAALPTNTRHEREERVRAAARTLLTQAYFAGLAFQDVVKLVQETDEELTGARHDLPDSAE
jgi:GntR family transcriptional regulator